MGKTAFMFPGQGAQYIGMAKDFYDAAELGKKVFQTASAAVGLNIEALCFEENEDIHNTEFTQIAMLTAETAILASVLEKGIRPDATIGLSLGEYAAIVASGALCFEDACKVIRQRGIFMEQEVPAGKGAMSAVIGLSADVIEKTLTLLRENVQIANYNCPGQIVISGEKKAVEEAGAVLLAAGAKRVIALNVSGPFHSEMLKGAGEKLEKVLEEVTFEDIEVPYVSNRTAGYVCNKEDIKQLLKEQVYSPVKFEQSIRMLIDDGVDTFIEIGPGKTLTSFVKKINKEVTIINIEKTEDLEKLSDFSNI